MPSTPKARAGPCARHDEGGGLERTIAAGDVTDATSFEEWLKNILHLGAGWQDTVLLTRALATSSEKSDTARAGSSLLSWPGFGTVRAWPKWSISSSGTAVRS